jgi:general secretion pathway protein J
MKWHGSPLPAARGFTLIEVLIALLLFALLAGFGYRGLGVVLDAGEQLAGETRKWRDLALAFEHLRQSLSQAVDRPIRDRDDSSAPAFVGAATTRNSNEPMLAFTRMGYAGHAGAAADQQRVGYRLREDRLEQLGWPVLDQAPLTEPQAIELLPGVQDLSFSYLHEGRWFSSWPIPTNDAAHPAAVMVKLQLAGGERYQRVFALP